MSSFITAKTEGIASGVDRTLRSIESQNTQNCAEMTINILKDKELLQVF